MTHQVIKRFVDRVRQSARGQSKQLILSMDEAQDIGNDLALLLLRENELLREISELKSTNAVTEIVIGGGGFK